VRIKREDLPKGLQSDQNLLIGCRGSMNIRGELSKRAVKEIERNLQDCGKLWKQNL